MAEQNDEPERDEPRRRPRDDARRARPHRDGRGQDGAGGDGRPQRSGGPQRSERPRREGRPGSDAPRRSGEDRGYGAGRPERQRRDEGSGRSDDRPRRFGGGARSAGSAGRLPGEGGRRHADTARGASRGTAGPERRRPERRDPGSAERSQRWERPERDEPALPDDVRPGDLDRGARAELKSLTKENADVVARHLVMAARLLVDDPAEAHRHALAAAARGGRVAVVRESVAITAYAVGDFALAVRELRTFRRISGSDDQIALLVDSERGMGRPEHALETGRAVDRDRLPVEAQVGLAIAMSGARLDLGDPRAALDELERAPLTTDRVFPWSPELFLAFATVHEELGDIAEAERWQRLADRAAAALDAAAAEFSEVEITEIDAPEAEVPEAEGPEMDVPEIVAPEVAAPEPESPEAEAAETRSDEPQGPEQ